MIQQHSPYLTLCAFVVAIAIFLTRLDESTPPPIPPHPHPAATAVHHPPSKGPVQTTP